MSAMTIARAPTHFSPAECFDLKKGFFRSKQDTGGCQPEILLSGHGHPSPTTKADLK